jgi:hypothetical protein
MEPVYAKASATEVAVTTTSVQNISLDTLVSHAAAIVQDMANEKINFDNNYASSQTQLDAVNAKIAQFRALGVQTQAEIDAANPDVIDTITTTGSDVTITPVN